MPSNIRVKRVCEFCKIEFIAQKTTTRFCSKKCATDLARQAIRQAKIQSSDEKTEKLKTQSKSEQTLSFIKVSTRQRETLNQVQEREFLNVKQVSMLLGVSRATLYNMVARGQIPLFKIGTRSIFKRQDLEIALERATITANALPFGFKKENFFTITEAQEFMGLPSSTFSAMMKRHNIPKYRSPSRFVYIPKDALDALKKSLLGT